MNSSCIDLQTKIALIAWKDGISTNDIIFFFFFFFFGGRGGGSGYVAREGQMMLVTLDIHLKIKFALVVAFITKSQIQIRYYMICLH